MRRPRPLIATVGLVAVVVLAGCLATIAVRAGRSSSPSAHASTATPSQVSVRYYDDLHQQDASAAFALLCPGQQQQGEGTFAQTLGLDQSSGTGIATFRVTGDATVTDQSASVPAVVSLDDGESTPIHVLLTHGDTGWQVCSSDLGGVLPAPGSSAAASSAV